MYSPGSIIFTDKLTLNFSTLKARNTKRKKSATVLFSIAADGTILKPLAVLNAAVRVNDYERKTCIVWTQNADGDLSPEAVNKWVTESLAGSQPKLLISHSYELFQRPHVIQALKEKEVDMMLLPKGLACMLSPMKGLLPHFLAAVTKAARTSEYMKKQQRMKGNDVLDWIVDGVNVLTAEHGEDLRLAFKCLN